MKWKFGLSPASYLGARKTKAQMAHFVRLQDEDLTSAFECRDGHTEVPWLQEFAAEKYRPFVDQVLRRLCSLRKDV